MGQASQESWAEYRRRMLAETSRFIEWGLKHPEMVTWIPSKPVQQGGFPRGVADWFWSVVLVDGESRRDRWRERLSVAARTLRWRR